MIIYDKAMWQIDNGISDETVKRHFDLVFNWLAEKEMLSNEGKEVLNIGIDSSISLNEKMVNQRGNEFLNKYYDNLIRQSNYDVLSEKGILDKMYSDFSKGD